MTICNFTEIIGTKDYRKPEWVSHMEEMQEALKGNVYLLLFFSIIGRLKKSRYKLVYEIKVKLRKNLKHNLHIKIISPEEVFLKF